MGRVAVIHWTGRFAILLLVFASLPAFGQKAPTAGGGGGSAPTSTGGSTPVGNPTLSPNLNPNNTNNPSNDPFASQPIFISGKVMFDDGSPVNKDVRIERVCGATARTEASVDTSGRFSFEVGGNTQSASIMMDASQSDLGSGSRMGSGPQSQGALVSNTNTGNSRRLSPEMALWGCELRAAYPGYRSDAVSLAGHKSMDDPNIGTIILHRLANVEGTTISITTAEAPKSAQKNFEKGTQAARKNNWGDAEKRFLAATSEYPKYAVAWFALGQVQEQQNRAADARKSYQAAIEADKRYVSPLDQLALLAAHESNWPDAARYSKQVIDLNPVEFPEAYWYSAVANYNLNQDAEAAKSGKALIKLDTRHRFPEVNRMMAELALRGQDLTAAAEYLKAYLGQVPNAKDADVLKQQLLKIEEANAAPKR